MVWARWGFGQVWGTLGVASHVSAGSAALLYVQYMLTRFLAHADQVPLQLCCCGCASLQRWATHACASASQGLLALPVPAGRPWLANILSKRPLALPAQELGLDPTHLSAGCPERPSLRTALPLQRGVRWRSTVHLRTPRGYQQWGQVEWPCLLTRAPPGRSQLLQGSAPAQLGVRAPGTCQHTLAGRVRPTGQAPDGRAERSSLLQQLSGCVAAPSGSCKPSCGVVPGTAVQGASCAPLSVWPQRCGATACAVPSASQCEATSQAGQASELVTCWQAAGGGRGAAARLVLCVYGLLPPRGPCVWIAASGLIESKQPVCVYLFIDTGNAVMRANCPEYG